MLSYTFLFILLQLYLNVLISKSADQDINFGSYIYIYDPPHHEYFKQNAAALQQAIRCVCSVCTVQLTAKIDTVSMALYIVFTAHEGHELPKKYIVYNLEQLGTDKDWGDHIFKSMRNAVDVWDYSFSNIRILKTRGIIAHHVPLGYSEAFLNPYNGPKFDALFIGGLNERRLTILRKIESLLELSDRNISICRSCWGSATNSGSVGINLHYYSGRTVLEVHRIIPWVVNKVVVVTVPSDDSWYDTHLKSIATFANVLDIPAVVLKIIQMSPEDKEELASQRYAILKRNLDYKRLLLRSGALHVFNWSVHRSESACR